MFAYVSTYVYMHHIWGGAHVLICVNMCECASYVGGHFYVLGTILESAPMRGPADEPVRGDFVCAVYTFRLVDV